MLTPQMQEIVDWWDKYGIKNWERDDCKPIFKQLLWKIWDLPTGDESAHILAYLIGTGRLCEYGKYVNSLHTRPKAHSRTGVVRPKPSRD